MGVLLFTPINANRMGRSLVPVDPARAKSMSLLESALQLRRAVIQYLCQTGGRDLQTCDNASRGKYHSRSHSEEW